MGCGWVRLQPSLQTLAAPVVFSPRLGSGLRTAGTNRNGNLGWLGEPAIIPIPSSYLGPVATALHIVGGCAVGRQALQGTRGPRRSPCRVCLKAVPPRNVPSNWVHIRCPNIKTDVLMRPCPHVVHGRASRCRSPGPHSQRTQRASDRSVVWVTYRAHATLIIRELPGWASA